MTYDPQEQNDILVIFRALLAGPTQDGGNKRAAGEKPPWYEDEHESHFWNHIGAWQRGEMIDPDSGADPRTHAAWRLLAMVAKDQRVHLS